MKKLFILMAVAIFVVGSIVPAMAQDKTWSWYGSARMWTEYRSVDKEVTTSTIVTNPLAGLDDEEELVWDLQSNSRLGVIAKWGDIGGQIEYGTGVNLRLLYGTWNFGPGTLLFGQDYMPSLWGVSSQCGFGGGDCGLIGWGEVYPGRIPQLKLIMGNFQVALLRPNSSQLFTTSAAATQTIFVSAGAAAPPGSIFISTDGITDVYVIAAGTPNFSAVDTDFTLPKIEASYTFNLGPAALWMGAGWNTIDLQGVRTGTTTIEDKSLDSWFGSIGAKFNFGPFYVNGKLSYVQNPASYGLPQDIGLRTPSYNLTSNSFNDVDSMMAMLVLGFKMSDAIKFEAGFGFVSNERDNAPGITQEEEVWAYYIQMSWSPAKNVFIIPELGIIDYGEREVTGAADVDLGKVTYFGVKWQINF